MIDQSLTEVKGFVSLYVMHMCARIELKQLTPTRQNVDAFKYQSHNARYTHVYMHACMHAYIWKVDIHKSKSNLEKPSSANPEDVVKSMGFSFPFPSALMYAKSSRALWNRDSRKANVAWDWPAKVSTKANRERSCHTHT